MRLTALAVPLHPNPPVRRWSDLLVCEHLALETLYSELAIPAARSAIHCYAGRTFLEVLRFDRIGAHGRSQLCSLASQNGALLGKAGLFWPAVAAALLRQGWLAAETVETVGVGDCSVLDALRYR